jgi:hypothetical protein
MLVSLFSILPLFRRCSSRTDALPNEEGLLPKDVPAKDGLRNEKLRSGLAKYRHKATRAVLWLNSAKLFRGKGSARRGASPRPVDAASLRPNFSAISRSTSRFFEVFAVSGQRPWQVERMRP